MDPKDSWDVYDQTEEVLAGGLATNKKAMDLLDYDAVDFEAALKEFDFDNMDPDRAKFLRDAWAEKNTLSGQMSEAIEGATEVDEDRVRANILPMTRPKGMTGWEAIRSGEANFALPGLVVGAGQEIADTLKTGEKMTSGIATTKDELQQAAMVVGSTGMAAPALSVTPANTLRSGLGRRSADRPDIPAVTKYPEKQVEQGFKYESLVSDLKDYFDKKIIEDENVGFADSADRFKKYNSVLENADEELVNDLLDLNTNYDPRAAAKDILKKYGTDKVPEGVTAFDLQVLSQHLESSVADSPSTLFRSATSEVVGTMEIGKKGILGARFLNNLRRNPDVRDTEWMSLDLEIEPNKKYTRSELSDIVNSRAYEVNVREGEPKYESYQRQSDVGLDDTEISYFELDVYAIPKGDSYAFEPKRAHFSEDTLAHTRASLRGPLDGVTDKEFLLVEEFQSDLLQGGSVTPRPAKAVSVDDNIKAVNENLSKQLSSYIDIPRPIVDVWDNLSDGKKRDIIKTASDGSYGDLIDVVNHYFSDEVDFSYQLSPYTLSTAINDIVTPSMPGRRAPPIKKTSESVSLAIDALISKGQTEGITQIIIPPFEKIVAARFRSGSEEYNKALSKKSGFYMTYVDAVNKKLSELKNQGGVTVQSVNLPYATESLQGTLIDFSELSNKKDLTRPRFAEGGLATNQGEIDSMNSMYEEGGLTTDGMGVDPVSGNEIPLGSNASDVRDDIPTNLSEGEYVVPADVLRYYGVKFFEELRANAKGELEEMGEEGRIGGSPAQSDMAGMDDMAVPEGVEETMASLSPEDMAKLDQALSQGEVGMAEGGLAQVIKEGAPTGSVGMNISDDTDMLLDRVLNVVKNNPDLQNKLRARGMNYADGGMVAPEAIEDNLKKIFGGSTGYAEGGYAGSFNPADYQMGFSFADPYEVSEDTSDIELVAYTNASGQTIMIRTVDGKPIDSVPDGYYLKGSAPATPATTTGSREDKDSSGYGAQPTGARATDSQAKASKNYYAMTPEELSKEMNTTKQLSRGATLLASMVLPGVGGLIGAGTAKAMGQGRHMALGSVAGKLAEEALAAGNTELAASYKKVAAGAATGGMGSDTAAEYYLKKFDASREALTGPTQSTAVQKAISDTKASGTKSTTGGVSYKSDSKDGGDSYGVKVATGSTAPTSSSRPQGRPGGSSSSGSSSSGSSSSGSSSSSSGNSWKQSIANAITPNDGKEYRDGKLVSTNATGGLIARPKK